MWVLHQVEQLLLHRQIAQYGLDERHFGEIVFAEKLLLLKELLRLLQAIGWRHRSLCEDLVYQSLPAFSDEAFEDL